MGKIMLLSSYIIFPGLQILLHCRNIDILSKGVRLLPILPRFLPAFRLFFRFFLRLLDTLSKSGVISSWLMSCSFSTSAGLLTFGSMGVKTALIFCKLRFILTFCHYDSSCFTLSSGLVFMIA